MILFKLMGALLNKDTDIDKREVKLTNGQKDTLDAFAIKYKGRTLKQILNDIQEEKLWYLDSDGNPQYDYEMLDDLYEEIKKTNK